MAPANKLSEIILSMEPNLVINDILDCGISTVIDKSEILLNYLFLNGVKDF